MTIRAVLWDADGVLQRNPADWSARFEEAVGEAAQDVVSEVFAPLAQCLTGALDMVEHVTAVLDRRGLLARRDAVLAIWRLLEPVAEVRALVGDLAVPSYLATNQDTWRATCMREQMGYDDLLAGSYYSCDLGAGKPDAGFFTAILTDLELAPTDVLFLDDAEVNVRGARVAGLRAEVWHHDRGTDDLRALLKRYGITA